MTAVVKEARYILTSLENNNNKFWNIRLFDDNHCETQWGRVGESGQSKDFAGATQSFFDSKCREKENKGYHPQKTLGNGAGSKAMENDKLADVAKNQIATNSPETVALVTYLAKANVHSILQATTMEYDTSRGTFSTPLGIVTQDAIQDARALLTDISQYIHAQDYANKGLFQKLNDYLMLVPQNIGRGRPDPRVLYPDLEAVQAQNNILDSLEASLQTVLSTPKNPDEAVPPRLFEATLNLVNDGREIDRIRRKYHATLQNMHACAHLDVKRVFSVEIGAMHRAFASEGRPLGNVQELWHGTKASNLLSILKSGFYIPPTNAPFVTGRMFGNGSYFSDQATKSLNYCVAPGVRVLKSDLSWIPASDLQVGDELLAFDEERSEVGRGRSTARRWRKSIVTGAGRANLPSVEVIFDNGERMIVSRGHQFLFCHTASKVEWRNAEDLKPGNVIPKYAEIWEPDKSYEAGWLAGFFDGEGYIGPYGLGANQNPGDTYERLVSHVCRRSHENWTISRKQHGSSSTLAVWLKGPAQDRMRFLGEIRPERLIRNFVNYITRNTLFQCHTRRRVAEIRDVGLQNVVTLGTSSRTFIAEGYASHNSYGYWDGKRQENCFMLLCEVAMGKSYAPPGPSSNLPMSGTDSTFAIGGKSGVANNEMIVYKTNQIDPRFLIEFSPAGKQA